MTTEPGPESQPPQPPRRIGLRPAFKANAVDTFLALIDGHLGQHLTFPWNVPRLDSTRLALPRLDLTLKPQEHIKRKSENSATT